MQHLLQTFGDGKFAVMLGAYDQTQALEVCGYAWFACVGLQCNVSLYVCMMYLAAVCS